MRIQKHTPSTRVIERHAPQQQSTSWRRLVAALLLAIALFKLTSCSSLPPDVAVLQEENDRLHRLLQECEEDARSCLDLLQECEALRQ